MSDDEWTHLPGLDAEDLELIHRKISKQLFWTTSMWMEDSLDGRSDSRKSKNNDPVENESIQTCLEIDEPSKKLENAGNRNGCDIRYDDFVEVDALNCVEIQHEDEKVSEKLEIINIESDAFNYEYNGSMQTDIQSCVELQCGEILHGDTAELDDDLTRELASNSLSETECSIVEDEAPSCLKASDRTSNDQEACYSFSTDDSGIESVDSVFADTGNSLVKNDIAVEKPSKNHGTNVSDDHTYPWLQNRNNSIKRYSNKRKAGNCSEVCKTAREDVAEGSDGTNEVATKRHCAPKKSREVLVSEESPIIEGEFEDSRRVTRLLVKSNVEKPVKPISNTPGKLVWGYFRTAWWPALIIKAEDAGMIATTGKIWVAWIGEPRISELREKYVDDFSNDLERRLDSLTINPKTKAVCKKQKDDCCYQTILMLKRYFKGGALMKPYTSWIKKNIMPHRDQLDELIFYPYPEFISENLKNLKEMNFQKTENYLRDQEKERLAKVTEVKNPTRKVVEVSEKPIEEGGINIMDQTPGMIVWAKIQGYCLWPCVIMDYRHLNRRQPNVAHQWVMWYGDYKYSQVQYRQILTFSTGMEKMSEKIQGKKDELFCKAVLRASKDYCDQLDYSTEHWKLNDVINLFFKSKDRLKLRKINLVEPDHQDLYSETIKKQLREQINNQTVDDERKDQILESENLKFVLSGDSSLESLCITCFRSDEELQKHPFFHASMCNKCLDEFRPKMFAYGDDGKCFFCALCGSEDVVAMCDNMNCPRVFCTACITYIICPDSFEEVLLKHPWYCFLCEPKSIENSVVKIRKNWKQGMQLIYRLNCDERKSSNLERFENNRKIRVLSLFDGIGTGYLVLKELNINIECYYASEIDPDSIQVSFFNHGKEIIQLGDVRNIDERKIKEIAPIDLLIGGSPCNELSLANPKRRGLDDPEGTGVLFYDYCRIKKLIEKHNKKRHLFWLFENVASMPKKFRNQISENLGREPKFLDSADFSAQHRPRLYWGNLPWGPYEAKDVVLQDVLRKQCNRQALVKKIMTVTTRMNSLNQTKENLRPVLMDGKKDMLWVTELEEIFGFPIHYTDANLQKTRRLQLIGKAWSVQTLVAILRPMFYF